MSDMDLSKLPPTMRRTRAAAPDVSDVNVLMRGPDGSTPEPLQISRSVSEIQGDLEGARLSFQFLNDDDRRRIEQQAALLEVELHDARLVAENLKRAYWDRDCAEFMFELKNIDDATFTALQRALSLPTAQLNLDDVPALELIMMTLWFFIHNHPAFAGMLEE